MVPTLTRFHLTTGIWLFGVCYGLWSVRGFFIRLDPLVSFGIRTLLVAFGVWAFWTVLGQDFRALARLVRQPRELALIVAAFIGVVVAGDLVLGLLQAVTGLGGYELRNDEALAQFVDKQPKLVSAILICVLGPLGEELFFRGFLLRFFGRWWGIVSSIVVSSLIFGAVHMSGLSAAEFIFVIPHICAGIGFAIAAWRGGIVLSFILHAWVNTMAILPVLLS
ncbi:CPBP family intramembrane glutamic endopeptidase [Corynebacterium glaucum]|uniref:CPBP family intramembrane glutamic endopeptidase n=1 Tax=Corynebacterium glaucum TaxID=187491 RepID=UPI00265ACE9F|nr:CPBP family intramembrane glutamic endopeptidase [Corynebacterium glaucum]